MAISMLWGFGGVRFEEGSNVKNLADCKGRLGFRPEKTVHRLKNGGTAIHSKGFRAIIEIEMMNIGINTATAGQMAGLMQMLSNAQRTGITIYPRFAVGSEVGYLCHLLSDIDPKDISYNIPIGQSLTLSFEGMNLIESIPTYISDENLLYLIDKDGNTYIDKESIPYVVV